MPPTQLNDSESISESQLVPLSRFDGVRAFVDLAIATEDHKLIVIGWIFDPGETILGLSLLQAEGDGNYARLPVEHGFEGMQLVRVPRPDVTLAMSGILRARNDMHGFIAIVPMAPSNAELALETAGGDVALVPFIALTTASDCVRALKQLTGVPQHMLLTALRTSIGDDHPLYALVRDLPDDMPTGQIQNHSPDVSVNSRSKPRLGAVLADFSTLPAHVEKPETVVGCVDRGYPLGDSGLLVQGWCFFPKREPDSISVHDDAGRQVAVADRLTRLSRLDVVSAYRSRFPNVDSMSGYAILAPLKTGAGEPRALCFDFGDAGKTWLKIPTEKPANSGVALAKELLGMITNPAEVRSRLYEIFDKLLGEALEEVISSRRPVKADIDVLQFGPPPQAPEVSLVVPLYGRFDFVRHQLTHFADDPGFRTADLIYVVDDPSIVAPVLDLAARYHQLFGVPFRVVWYGENRGYAGANNIGARFARGRHLVLLNSDVIPQQPGWLSTLATALESLPAAGAVGPLLQFGDGAIQHAGMYPRTDVSWPGFILNTHRFMGMAWTGDDRPSQHPMLTAACLMLRTEDFRRVGGFDENYLIGDFEDSDLCLSLRKLGRKLYLVPEAKLWHLERQSQNLDTAPTQRQLVTLFNGWRYSRKIRNGELVDPLTLDISA